MNYTLRESVYTELENIWTYSFEHWGQHQADQYIRDLMARFQWLSENPHAGKPRDDIKAGYYCYPQGRHLVFYRIETDNVDILGIPHQSMDVDKYLD